MSVLSTILKMPIMPEIECFAGSEDLARFKALDTKIRSFKLMQCSQDEQNIGLDKLWAQYIVDNHRGMLLHLYNWSKLASLTQKHARPLTAICERQAIYQKLEQTIFNFESSLFTIEALQKLAGVALGKHKQKFRRIPMGTDADQNGNRTEFIDVKHIPKQIQIVLSAINKPNEKYPNSLNAIWVMIAFLNCHPFVDGNGRTGRSLFNLILIRSGLPILPLAAIQYASGGFFDVCARQMQLHRKCDLMLGYLESVTGFLIKHQNTFLNQY